MYFLLIQIALADIYNVSYPTDTLSAFDTTLVRKRPPRKRSNKTPTPVNNTIPYSFEGQTRISRQDTEMDVDPVEEEQSGSEMDDRPYRCKLEGCAKAYKNPGGLKYHMQHGHCEDTGDPVMNNIIHKPYQCTVDECGKRYKNLNGLKVFIVNLVSYRACSYISFG